VPSFHQGQLASHLHANLLKRGFAARPTITWLGLAQILREHLGPAGEHVTTNEAPGEDPSPLTIHNDRAKQELGWQPRAAQTTIVETAESLRELGLLDP